MKLKLFLSLTIAAAAAIDRERKSFIFMSELLGCPSGGRRMSEALVATRAAYYGRLFSSLRSRNRSTRGSTWFAL